MNEKNMTELEEKAVSIEKFLRDNQIDYEIEKKVDQSEIDICIKVKSYIDSEIVEKLAKKGFDFDSHDGLHWWGAEVLKE